MTDRQVYIVAAAIVLGGFFAGGIYDMRSGQMGTWVANRFTGHVWMCGSDGCVK